MNDIVAILAQAAKKFSILEDAASNSGGEVQVTEDMTDAFTAAHFAHTILLYLGKDKLLELEREGVINNSTISGSSLSSALTCARDYMTGKTDKFSKDNYEQLGRSCRSVKRLYELGRTPDLFHAIK